MNKIKMTVAILIAAVLVGACASTYEPYPSGRSTGSSHQH